MRSNRWSLYDQFLRRHGFAIHDRPEGVEPRWIRDGRVYFESHALDLARGEIKGLEKKGSK
jgi:hypothetical protein